MQDYRMFIDGDWRDADTSVEVRSPFSGDVVSRVPLASEQDIEDALASACRGFEAMRAQPAYRRTELLLALRDGVRGCRQELAHSIVLEAGKPITDALVEVDRAANVLTLAAEETKRIQGDVIPLDLAPTSTGRFALTRRFPIGPVVGISPFNFPLNLGMHKVAPALAAGASILWKPSLQTPGAALTFARIAQEAGLPSGALNVVTPPDSLAEKLVTDPRTRVVSFTGSPRVGWALRAQAARKRVTLELGGNAAVAVCADADLENAVSRCVAGGFAYSGQVCISVQRILVEEAIYKEFLDRLVGQVECLPTGDPLDPATKVGPMVNDREASRVEEWLREAAAGGARIRTGGTRNGRFIAPTVLTETTPQMKVSCQEVFGPVVTVSPFRSWEEALSVMNDSSFGLQAGLFTRDLQRVFQAYETLDVGGVIVNDVPTYRMDSMPYGGVKESGLGREGVKYAIEEMTEVRLLALNLQA